MRRKVIPSLSLSLLTVVIVLLSLSSTSLAQQLVGHWKFDEGSGNTAQDSSGKNNNGEIINAKWTDGKSGKALAFVDYVTGYSNPDPKNASYVRVKHNDSLNPAKGFDISAVINIEPSFSPTFAATIVEKGGGYGCSYRLLLTKDFKVRAVAGNEHVILDSATRLTPGKWTTLRVTYDGQSLKIYIDDKEDASTAAQVKGLSSNDDLIMGRRFTGKIDEVKISIR